MADWKRNFPGRTIPFVGGVMTDATANDLPCYDLENFLPPPGMNNGLAPRDGILPHVDLSGSTLESTGAVILEITNDDPARTRTIAVMQADGKEIIRLGTYTDMEGRKGLNPYSGGEPNDPNNDGEDLPYTPPVPPPVGVENAAKFVLSYEEVAESMFDVPVYVDCDGEGGTIWYEIYWIGKSFGYVDITDAMLWQSGTLFAANGDANTIQFNTPTLSPSYDQEWLYINLLIKSTSDVQLVNPSQMAIKLIPKPPDNDDLEDAILIAAPQSLISLDTKNATLESNENATDKPGTVWYKFEVIEGWDDGLAKRIAIPTSVEPSIEVELFKGTEFPLTKITFESEGQLPPPFAHQYAYIIDGADMVPGTYYIRIAGDGSMTGNFSFSNVT